MLKFLLYNYSPYSNIINSFKKCLLKLPISPVQKSIQNHALHLLVMSLSESYQLEQFLSLCLVRLIFLKNTDHLFCIMFLNLGLSDGLSCLNSGYAFFVGMSRSNVGCFSLHHMRSCKKLWVLLPVILTLITSLTSICQDSPPWSYCFSLCNK